MRELKSPGAAGWRAQSVGRRLSFWWQIMRRNEMKSRVRRWRLLLAGSAGCLLALTALIVTLMTRHTGGEEILQKVLGSRFQTSKFSTRRVDLRGYLDTPIWLF